MVGTNAKFVKGKHFFKQVATPQVGDIGWWNGHMAIYDLNAGKTKPEELDGNLWSARNTNRPFGAARIDWYVNRYGAVKWYRYWKPEGEK